MCPQAVVNASLEAYISGGSRTEVKVEYYDMSVGSQTECCHLTVNPILVDPAIGN